MALSMTLSNLWLLCHSGVVVENRGTGMGAFHLLGAA